MTQHPAVKALGSFEAYLEWVIATPDPYPKDISNLQNDMVSDTDRNLLVDFVGRYETLDRQASVTSARIYPLGAFRRSGQRADRTQCNEIQSKSHTGDSMKEKTANLGFFDEYPLFFETSDTLPYDNRLNNRYRALIERNLEILKGASVLDLASHDGRWSFAALKSGARRIVGLEGQPVLVANAEKTFKAYGIDKDRYRFVAGDLFETIKEFQKGAFDVAFCFGFLHMHNRHFEMLKQIESLAPRYLVMDVWVLPFTQDPVTYLLPHIVDEHGSARYMPDYNYPLGTPLTAARYPLSVKDGSGMKFGSQGTSGEVPEIMMTAFPSPSALEWLLAEAGFGECSYYDWNNADLSDWNHLSDYQAGQRVSLTASNLRIRN
ncbi:MAG: class I SAM-dependent methyltransferase [Methylococcales bacterium]